MVPVVHYLDLFLYADKIKQQKLIASFKVYTSLPNIALCVLFDLGFLPDNVIHVRHEYDVYVDLEVRYLTSLVSEESYSFKQEPQTVGIVNAATVSPDYLWFQMIVFQVVLLFAPFQYDDFRLSSLFK